MRHRSDSSTALTTNGAKAVTLNNMVTVTFPCAAHATDLSSDPGTGTNAYEADCSAYTDPSSQGFIYSATLEQFPAGSSAQTATLTYCTAQQSYPGTKPGSKIYVTHTNTQRVDDKKFSVCDLSANNTDSTYEATARAATGNYDLVLQVDAPEPPTANTLQTAIRTFVSTVTFNK